MSKSIIPPSPENYELLIYCVGHSLRKTASVNEGTSLLKMTVSFAILKIASVIFLTPEVAVANQLTSEHALLTRSPKYYQMDDI
jgi:hypothetical protein